MEPWNGWAIINHESPPLVPAAEQQRDVEEDAEEEAPCDGDPEAVPPGEVGDGLLRQEVGPRGDAGVGADVHAQRLAHGPQHPHLEHPRQRRQRRVVEHLHAAHEAPRGVAELVLHHRLVRVLHQRQVVEPDPVPRDAVPVDEEAAEEQEASVDTTTGYPSITLVTTPERNVAKPEPAQKEASTMATKKKKPSAPPARPTAKKVVSANAKDSTISDGKPTMVWEST
ncbi:LOW QUALITY PROTEIN: hypothetical protein U9M48_007032 [Paspalum notatum var. saurae]|uniref:Uncharacterized protein n=1 Tax=Paspalum notatum var. saurae TaxID=547442 RepID=A0AAQ3PTN5_PASNO